MTVSPRSVSTIGRSGRAPVDLRMVLVLGRRDVQTEQAQHDHVRLDGARTKAAAARVRQLEVVHAVQQRAQEHDDQAGAYGSLGVDRRHVQLGRRHDLHVDPVVDPPFARPLKVVR